MNISKRYYSLFFLISLLIVTSINAEPRHLSLVTPAKPPLGSDENYTGVLEKISREAFRRIGVTVDFTILPGERCLINVDSGIDDADVFRAPGVEADYPNLVQVPESIGLMEFMGYSKLQIDNFSWASLEPYVVAYVNGWKIYDRNVKAREITKVRQIEDLFTLLENGRAEIILLDRWQGQYVAKQMGYKYHPIEPPLATIEMFMYVNIKHKDLIPQISQALKDMKRDGTIDKYYDELRKSL